MIRAVLLALVASACTAAGPDSCDQLEAVISDIRPRTVCIVERQPGDVSLWHGAGAYYAETQELRAAGLALYGPVLSDGRHRGAAIARIDGTCEFVPCVGVPGTVRP